MTTKTKVDRYRYRNYNETWTDGPDHPPRVVNSNEFFVDAHSSVDLGENFPDWKTRLRNNVNCTTTLVGNYVEYILAPGQMRFDRVYHGPDNDPYRVLLYHPSSYNIQGGQLLGVPPVTTPTGFKDAQATNEAIEKFVQKARSIQTQFESGVFLGQLRQTLDQVTRPAKALREGLTSYLTSLAKRRHRTRKADKQKIISDTWLEYVYGWRPLINDISGAITAATSQPALSDVQHVFARARAEEIIATGEASVGIPGLSILYQGTMKEICEVRLSGAVWVYSDDKPSLVYGNESMRKLGLTVDNFAPTLWELIPYSFLVDYFTNLGDVISALSYPTSNFAWKQISKKTWIHHYHDNFRATQNIFSDNDWGILVSGHLGKAEMKCVNVSRFPHLTDLIPDLRFKVPGASSLKWLNLAALGQQHRSLLPF